MALPRATIEAFLATLEGLDVLDSPNARFFYYDPQRSIPHDKRQPFATIITADEFDGASDLAARGLYRVNAGVERETYRALFGEEPDWNREDPVRTGHDFRSVDVFLPHPVYAPMDWICIIAPSDRSWPRLQELLREAHSKQKRERERRAP